MLTSIYNVSSFADFINLVKDNIKDLLDIPAVLALFVTTMPWWLQFALGLSVTLTFLKIFIRVLTN